MPNRMIKDSLLSSDKIASLSDFEFRLWLGLILIVDDMGRGDARAAIIKGRVFPLRERVSLRDIEDALHGLAAKGCVSLYTVDGKPYFWFPTWGEHQRIRDSKPKYPSPEDGQSLPACGGSPFQNGPCGSARQTAADCGESPPETETETKPEPKTEPKDETETEPRMRGESVVVVVERVVGKLRSAKARHELDGFIETMGADCVLKALDVAVEAGQEKWPYVRGILLKKQERGVRSAEDWDKDETRHQAVGAAVRGGIAGTPIDVQPSLERGQRSAERLGKFLREQEGKTAKTPEREEHGPESVTCQTCRWFERGECQNGNSRCWMFPVRPEDSCGRWEGAASSE